jgi:hypothetical protein
LAVVRVFKREESGQGRIPRAFHDRPGGVERDGDPVSTQHGDEMTGV